MWAGNLSKLGDGACVLLMTPHTLHCTSTYCSLCCTHLSFLPLQVPVPSVPPAQHPPSAPLKAKCAECAHTHTVHMGRGRQEGGLVPGASLSESINQADRSSCHRHLCGVCTHTRHCTSMRSYAQSYLQTHQSHILKLQISFHERLFKAR